MNNYLYISGDLDARMNLAVDQYILDLYRRGRLSGVTLYFYVNRNAVIIGRNQNAWRECDLGNMKRDGVTLVRRHTGGGAVYHDEGNLNFSFITTEKHYNVARQSKVIVDACRDFGINAEVTGRNDILADGKKFSGNAFALEGKARGHHGTLLISADLTRLPQYLNVSPQKLAAKGISSVRSRVCDLNELAPVTVDDMRKAIVEHFAAEYGNVEELVFNETDRAEIERLYRQRASWEWTMGSTPEFDQTIETRLPSGELQLHLKLKAGTIADAVVYTDSLDTGAASEIASLVKGVRFDNEELYARLKDGSDTAVQLGEYLLNNGVQ